MYTILITGSEGNIGTYMLRRLTEKRTGVTIIRVGKKTRSHEHYYAGDLRDEKFVKKIFAENRIDCVIHAAAKSYEATIFKNEPYSILAHDLQCLLTVLNEGSKIKKFVYVSSATVYESSLRTPYKEDATLEMPKSPYGIAKFFGEQAVILFAKQHGLPYTIWRAFNVVSPLEPHDTAGGHVFIDLYRKIFVQKQEAIELFGSGKQIRCFTWVEDTANAIADFLTDTRTDGEIFNLGSTEQTSLDGLVAALINIGKQKGLLPEEYNPKIITGIKFHGVDSEVRVPDMSKVKKILEWQAQTNFSSCFEKFIEEKSHVHN